MRKRTFSSEVFKEIYSQVPKLTVDAVIATEKGVVMTKRKADGWVGQWHFPGGTVLYREKVIDAVRRIVQEELGVNVEVEEFIGYVEFFSEEKERGFGYSVSLCFRCTSGDGIPERSMLGEEVGIFRQIPEEVVMEHGQILEKILTK